MPMTSVTRRELKRPARPSPDVSVGRPSAAANEVLFHCANESATSSAKAEGRRTPQLCERANVSGPEENLVNVEPAKRLRSAQDRSQDGQDLPS